MEQGAENKEIEVIKSNTPTFLDYAKKVNIINDEISCAANNQLAVVKQAIKKLDEHRKHLVKPAQETVKRINDDAKILSEPLNEARRILDIKVFDWLKVMEKRQEKEEKEKAEAVSGFLGEEVKSSPEPRSTKLSSTQGKSFLKKVWTWDVVDVNAIPHKYFSLDEDKITAMMKGNISTLKGVTACHIEIPGIKIYQKSQIATRR